MMRGLERLIADELERFGADYVFGRTDRPERRPPVPEKRPVFEPPTGPEDFD